MDNQDGFWSWIESLSRSLGWEDRSLEREGHLGTDNGAHHMLPGWGKHPAGEPDSPTGPDLEDAHERSDGRAKARIGKEVGRERSVYYDPDLPEAHLANGHLIITGESGTGKTQVMKTILADLQSSGVPSLVLDFKDDYAEKKYAAQEGYAVYDPTKTPLPFNPLDPSIDKESGSPNKNFHTYQLVEILGRIYHLGELQQHALREAIKAVYAEAGDAIPTFDAVKAKLESEKGNAEILGHLAPIFDFGFFSDPDPEGFHKIVGGNTVIRLAQLPGSEVKNSVAEFFLMALYNHLVRLEQTHLLRQVLVLDEAWRVVNSPFLEPLMREARAFGLGVFVATQFPTDLPLAVSGSAATDIYLGQSQPSQVQEVQRIVSGSTNSHEAEQVGTVLRGLLPLQAIVHNKQYTPYAKVDARPYYARSYEDSATVTAATVGSEPESGLPRYHGRYNFNLTKSAAPSEGARDECVNCGDRIHFDTLWVHSSNNAFCEKTAEAKGRYRARPRPEFAEGLAAGGWNYCDSCEGDGCSACKNSGLHYREDERFFPDGKTPIIPHGIYDTRDKVWTNKWGQPDNDYWAATKDVAQMRIRDIRIYEKDDKEREQKKGAKTLPCFNCSGSGNSEYDIGRPCRPCEGSGSVEWGGRAHDMEPDDESVNYFDFEDEMPREGPKRAQWHNEMLDILHDNHGIEVDDLKVNPNEWNQCGSCKGKGCRNCKNSGITDGSQDPDYAEAASRLHAKGLDTYDSDTRFEVYNGKANCDEEDCHDLPAKTAQEQVPSDDGKYICHRCHTGTENADQTCNACKAIVDDLVHSEDQSLTERIEQRVDQAEVRDTATPAEYWDAGRLSAAKQKCVSCGKSVHGNEFPLDSSNNALVAEEYDMQGPDIPQCFLCANDYDSYQYGVDTAKSKWEPLPPDTPCKSCKGSGMQKRDALDDYVETVDSSNEGSGWDPCWKCKGSGTLAPKTAEMQKFPPGEDEEEGPFAPFSMSEWQMVKGPKHRR